MSITSALVLLAVTWFMVLFFVLPFKARSQADEGEVVPGTHSGAPANFKAKKTAILVTLISIPLCRPSITSG